MKKWLKKKSIHRLVGPKAHTEFTSHSTRSDNMSECCVSVKDTRVTIPLIRSPGVDELLTG